MAPDVGAIFAAMNWNIVTSKTRGEALIADLNQELVTREQRYYATGGLGSRLSYQQRHSRHVCCVSLTYGDECLLVT